MSHKLRMSSKQSLAMIDFMEKNSELVLGKPKNPAAVKMLWYYLTKRLNEMRGGCGGAKKTTAMWMKSWWDKKCTLKKKLLKHGLPKEDDDSGPQYSRLEMKTIKLLLQEGEITQDEIDEGVAKNARIKEMVETENFFQSSNQLLNQSDDDSVTNTEYLDPCFNGDLEDSLEEQSKIVKITKKICNLKRHHNEPDSNPNNEPDQLQTEFSRVAFVEEKRLETEVRSSKARKNMAESLRRCASAMRALVEAVNHQGIVISEAYRAQGQMIHEAQKLQSEMIAKAIANR